VFFIFSIIVVGIFITNSQTVVYYSICKQKYALVNVSKTYERVIEKGYDSIQMREYLGNYYKIKDFQKSKLYFDMLFKKYKLSDISLKSVERYKTLCNW
jgi:TPP-dependent 2-oxoacid decarboxylase